MKALYAFVFILALSPNLSFAQSTEQEAGDISEVDKDRLGPLRERIPPVTGYQFLKKGRWEISPSVGLSLKDGFFTKYIFGGSLTYHPYETLGIGLRFGYSVATVSGNAEICTTDASGSRGCRSPTFAEVDGRAPGQITLLGGVDVQWAPIYGKISLLAEKFIRFDMYGIAGVAAIRYAGPVPSGSGSTSKFTPGGNLGLGFRFFINRWLTVRTELRDLIYLEDVQPMPNTSLRNQIVFELGISMFFPTTFSDL
jgi:outer membrane beta-barrel protein